MKRRIIALLLGAALIMGLCTACSAGGNNAGAGGSQPTTADRGQQTGSGNAGNSGNSQSASMDNNGDANGSAAGGDGSTLGGDANGAAGTIEALTIAIAKDENTLAPFTYVSGTGTLVNRLIYDTLMTTDLDNNIIPWMVEDDYQVVDSKVFTFTLKDGQKFHNGDPVTVEDVKFSFTYPATQNVSSQRKICNEIEAIDLVDEKTIRFTLKESDVNFMRDGFAYIRIIDDAVYENVEDGTAVTESIGSGMYRLVEYKTGEYYKLEAVEDYFRGTPRVKNLNMPIMTDSTAIQQGILSGELAAATSNIGIEMVDTFRAVDGLDVFSSAGYAPLIININNGRAPFDQADFRTALTYAIDVNGICKTLFGEYALPGTRGAVRSDLPYAQPGMEYTYDAQKAIELLEKCGYTETNGDGMRLDVQGEPLTFSIITYSGNATRSRACELIQSQLKEVGIQLDIQSLDMDTADAYIWPDFEVSNGRDYDLATWGWSTTMTMSYLISLCSSDYEQGTYNVCGYVSDAFDALVDKTLPEVRSEADMEALLRQLQDIIAVDDPLITIGYPDNLQVCNTKLYDGWKAGNGANVINIFTFLGQ